MGIRLELKVYGGAVVYQLRDGKPFFLLVQNTKSQAWEFLKDNKDANGTLVEAANQAILKGIHAQLDLDSDFNHVIEYQHDDDTKQVTFYLAEAQVGAKYQLSNSKYSALAWFDEVSTKEHLTFLNLKEVLNDAVNHIGSNK